MHRTCNHRSAASSIECAKNERCLVVMVGIFGDVLGIIYGLTADGFRHRELRDYDEDARSGLLLVPGGRTEVTTVS